MFVNVTNSRGVSAVGIQVISSSATSNSNRVLQSGLQPGYQSQPKSCTQSWGRYFQKVTGYILLVTFRKSNSLYITYYFQEKVTRYYYILLCQRVTSNILLVIFFTKVQYCSKNLVYTNPVIFKSV